jgi:hypothetical protein
MEEYEPNKVACEICGKQFTAITNTHLKKHELTTDEYCKLYPTASLVSDAQRERASKNAKLHNKPGVERPGIGAKISATKKAKAEAGFDYGAHLRGQVRTQEQRQHLSNVVKEQFKSGVRIHHMQGLTQAADTKAKIAESLKSYYAPIVQERLALEQQADLERAKLAAIELQANADRYTKVLSSKNIKLIELNDKQLLLKCDACGHDWQMTRQYINQSKIDLVACRICNPKLTTSKQELEVFNFIRGLCDDAVSGDRSVLGGRELDILVPSAKIAFEYNGLYWHSELNRQQPKHLLWKQQHAYKLGYKLFHIFEDEWVNKRSIVESKIRAILSKLEHKVYARQCRIVMVENNEKNEFLIANHLQGLDVSGIRYGLIDGNDRLVAIATFKKTSFIKGGDGADFELSRYATLCNTSVVGGASKLFKRFINDHQPKRIVSYADRRWSFGKMYDTIGFKFEAHTPPCFWYMKGYTNRIHRAAFMKHSLIERSADDSLTAWEIMQADGYDRIWDCGTLRYTWSSS